MKSLQKTVMLYVTILLVVVGVTAAIVSYFFVKGEVNSFQDNALQEVALTPVWCTGTIFSRASMPSSRINWSYRYGTIPKGRFIVPGRRWTYPLRPTWDIPT